MPISVGMQSPLICCGTTNHDMSRVCIYPKDLCKSLRIGTRQAQRKIKEAREGLNKQKHQYMTVKEFCDYMGLPEALFKDLK